MFVGVRMTKTSLIIIGIISSICWTNAQEYEKVYLDPSDSTKFYYQVTPDSQAKGLLVLLPGTRGSAEWPLKTTRIPYIAADSGLVTIMIDYEIWLYWLRGDVLELLNTSINDVLERHKIASDKCVIGGFSSGGTMALNYTALAVKDRTKTAILPKGVFGLDPPVDLTELYHVDQLEIKGIVCNGKKNRSIRGNPEYV